jgi:NTE family protein
VAADRLTDPPLGLPRPVGFVLGGGGSFGASQVGMLQALAERRVLPDLVAGTSVGSLNGTVVALDPTAAANRLSHLWAHMTRTIVFPGGLLAQARTLQRTRTNLFPNTGLATVIAEFLGTAATFADLTLPLGVVTTDTVTTQPYVITEGPLLPALLASAAIPAIYPLVEHDGRRLYDGGVVANVPMRQALAMGARSLVVLDCNFPGRLPSSPQTAADAVLFAVFVTMRSQAVLEAPIVAAQVPVLYLPGPSLRRISLLDFSHTEALIEEAYTAAREFLAGVAVDGPGLYGSPTG